MVSIKDVAQRAGVSISTVSNVLNGTKFVSETLRRRVMTAVEELGYQANPIARNMKSSRSHTVGVISTDIGGLFYPYVIKGLYNRFSQNGYNVHVFETDGVHDPRSSWERVVDGVRHFVEYRVDGIVLTSIFPANMEAYYADRILKLVQNSGKDIAIVSLETDFTRYGIDSVYANSVAGAERAVDHLVLKGCGRIAHITGPIFTRVSIERLTGYRNAMARAGLEVREAWIANGDYSHPSGYKAMDEILRRAPEIDGLFVANDQMAVGAMRRIHEAGLRIPEDIKVIGYDDVFISCVLEPPLSTMHVLKRTMGEHGAQLLIDRIEGRSASRRAIAIEMEARLVERRSTNPQAPDDWILSDW